VFETFSCHLAMTSPKCLRQQSSCPVIILQSSTYVIVKRTPPRYDAILTYIERKAGEVQVLTDMSSRPFAK
jgi:hypothetical protein